MPFFGYFIEKVNVRMDQKKVKVVVARPVPTKVSEL